MFEKQKGEGARERVRRGTIPLMSKDTSLHVHFMNHISFHHVRITFRLYT